MNYKDAMTKLLDKFENGNLGEVIDIATITITDDIPAAKWSLCNKLLALQATGTIDCRGYKQWQQVGRNVSKGQKAGAYIVAPMFRKDEDNKDVLAGFMGIPVWSFEQTEGETYAGQKLEPASMPPLMSVAEKFGVPVRYAPSYSESVGGWYNRSTNAITLCSHDERVFWHELGHAVHATIEDLSKLDKKYKETVAEFTACVLAMMYGRDYSGASFEYIKSYTGDPVQAVGIALKTIEKVVKAITESED